MKILAILLGLGLAIGTLPGIAGQPNWYVLAREDGCMDLKILARSEKLPRAPLSPEDFAQMMRERGEPVVVGPPADLPPELAGKVIQVKVGGWKAPVFVREDVCRNMGK